MEEGAAGRPRLIGQEQKAEEGWSTRFETMAAPVAVVDFAYTPVKQAFAGNI